MKIVHLKVRLIEQLSPFLKFSLTKSYELLISVIVFSEQM